MWKLVILVAVYLSGLIVFADKIDECNAPALQSIHDIMLQEESQMSLRYVTKTSGNAVSDFLLVSVATNQTNGYERFLRSANVYNIPVKTLGMNMKWEGGDMNYAGGGFKINLLRKEIAKYKDNKDKIIMFTDSYDVIVLGPVDKILERFNNFNARVVFSAEGYCWPDHSLENLYPKVQRGKRYLNSGGFIGYARELYEIVSSSEVKNTDDDQLFYTKSYLNEKLRDELKIKLDHRSEIFQNLNGATGDVELRFKGREAYLQNTVYNTNPLIVHGNGYTKLVLNSLGNYLANSWNPEDGCLSCWDRSLVLENKEESSYPQVLIAVFIEQPTPFLEEFFQKLVDLEYPKNKLHLFVHNNVEYHDKIVQEFTEKYGKSYKSVKKINPTDEIKEKDARNLAIDYCQVKHCDYYLNLDSEAHLDNPHSLRLLVEQNRSIVAPLMLRPYKAWSNFWGALTADGYYARSSDYMEIIHNERRGLWNVPYISACYLINATIITNPETRPSYEYENLDSDMAFCANMRNKNVFMYVNNRMDFGHLINPDNFEASKTNSEIYQLFDNRWDWEQRYIHENYSENFNPNKTALQPCPDVYWFPIVKPRFCEEFIEIMEDFGEWSDGSNKDPRLIGGYENVPTRDIHMNQVGLEQHWLEFLKQYVRPLQEMVFTGYIHDDPRIEGGYEAVPTRDIHMKQVGLADIWDFFLEEYVGPLQQTVFIGYTSPPRSLMNFVVRYRPDEQPSLRPHHDSSTYTINLALNRPKIDYKGGGCRFIRYNCSVTDTKLGWMLMHPGRLTHYHEGLPVTSGTRYIMISFVDP